MCLEHALSGERVKPDTEKTRAVRQFLIPRTKRNIKQFVGLVGYCWRFIQNAAGFTKPLTLLLKDIFFVWNKEAQSAFEALRVIITSEPLLQFSDFSQPILVTIVASSFAVGVVLSQEPIGLDFPIAYASRTLSKAEGNYFIIEKELLAILFVVEHFRSYLYRQRFTLVTDHRRPVWPILCTNMYILYCAQTGKG